MPHATHLAARTLDCPMRLLSPSLALLLAACSSIGPAARYYYPIGELTEGLVYAYESVGPLPAPDYYWYYRSVIGRDSTTLAATYYDAGFEPRQFTNERIVPTGVLRRDLRLFTPTDTTSVQTQAEVLAPAVFSFEAPDPDRLLVSAVRWREGAPGSSPEDPTSTRPTYTITHNRHYLRDTVVTVEGARRDAQVWQVRELVEQDSAGVLALEARAVEIYAEDVGLVYRERAFGDGTLEAYRLAERFVMDTLVTRAGR